VLPLKFVERGLKQFHEKQIEESKKEKVVLKPTTETYKKKKPRKSGNLFSIIRKIDGKK